MSLTKVSYSMITGAPVNVSDYGALGTGVDDTAAFVAAIASGATSIYVPWTASHYLVGDFDVPQGVTITGPGKLRYSGASSSGTDLSLEYPIKQAPKLILYVTSVFSYPALLEIVNIGANTVLHYLQFAVADGGTFNAATFAKLVNNVESLGLNLIPDVTYSATAPAFITAELSRPCITGLYLFDEPAFTGISIATQNALIAVYRPLTNKPLMCAQFGDFNYLSGGIGAFLSPNWDTILVDCYYNTGNTSYSASVDESNKAVALISFSQLSSAFPLTELIPIGGLFSDATFSNLTKSISFAREFVKLTGTGNLGAFVYDAKIRYPTQFTADIATNSDCRNAAIEIFNYSDNFFSRYTYTSYLFVKGEAIGGLTSIYNQSFSSVDMLPFSIVDVGASYDLHRQDYSDNGIGIANSGGILATNIVSQGTIVAYLDYQSHVTAPDPGTLSILYTVGDFYESPPIGPAATTNTVAYAATIDTGVTIPRGFNVPAGYAIGIKFVPDTPYVPIARFIHGVIVNSNWDTTSF